MKRTTSITLLVLALLFSDFIIMSFNLSGGFQSSGIKFQLLPLIAFSVNISEHAFLTSSIVGYILFTFFLLANFKRAKVVAPKSFYTALFSCVASVLFELYSFACDSTNNYMGQHLRIGLLLFLMCYNVFNAIYKDEKQAVQETN